MKRGMTTLLQWMLVMVVLAVPAGCGTVDKSDPTYNTKKILICDTRPTN